MNKRYVSWARKGPKSHAKAPDVFFFSLYGQPLPSVFSKAFSYDRALRMSFPHDRVTDGRVHGWSCEIFDGSCETAWYFLPRLALSAVVVGSRGYVFFFLHTSSHHRSDPWSEDISCFGLRCVWVKNNSGYGRAYDKGQRRLDPARLCIPQWQPHRVCGCYGGVYRKGGRGVTQGELSLRGSRTKERVRNMHTVPLYHATCCVFFVYCI